MSDSGSETKSVAGSEVKPPKRSLVRKALIGLVLLAVLLFCLPWIIAGTPLRNVLVNMAITDPYVQANVGSASIGWFSPLALEDLKVDIRQGETVLTVGGVQADRSWLDILLDRPELGRFDIHQPHIDVLLIDRQEQPKEPAPPSSATPSTTVSVAVHDGAFTLRAPEAEKPILEIRGFDATVHLEQRENGRHLRIEPGRLLDHQELTPEMCSRGLQLVAPIVAESSRAQGEISLELTRFDLPLDLPADERPLEHADIQGSLELHSVETSLKSPLLLAIGKVVSSLLQKDLPTTMQISRESNIVFRVRDGRIHHQGLAFGLPELSDDMVIRTEGSVGFDDTLDLNVSIPLPLDRVFDGPLAERLSEKPLQLHITGTLKEPKTQLAVTDDGWQGLLSGILSGANDSSDPSQPGDSPVEADEIVEGVLNLFQGALKARQERKEPSPEAKKNKPLNLLDRFRNRRNKSPRNQPGPPPPQRE